LEQSLRNVGIGYEHMKALGGLRHASVLSEKYVA